MTEISPVEQAEKMRMAVAEVGIDPQRIMRLTNGAFGFSSFTEIEERHVWQAYNLVRMTVAKTPLPWEEWMEERHGINPDYLFPWEKMSSSIALEPSEQGKHESI